VRVVLADFPYAPSPHLEPSIYDARIDPCYHVFLGQLVLFLLLTFAYL